MQYINYACLLCTIYLSIYLAICMFKYTHKLLPASFENNFKMLENFERSLNYQLDILKIVYHQALFLRCCMNNLPLDLKRSNSGIFKNRLLNFLFENYITMCYKPNCYSCKTNYICFNML